MKNGRFLTGLPMAMGQKRVPKNPIGKRKIRPKSLVPKGFLPIAI